MIRSQPTPGTYSIKTYHHETYARVDRDYLDLPGHKACPQFTVTLDDGDGKGRQITSTQGHSIGKSIGDSQQPSHTSFSFRANGEDPVSIRMVGKMGRLWISGFDLREALP